MGKKKERDRKNVLGVQNSSSIQKLLYICYKLVI